MLITRAELKRFLEKADRNLREPVDFLLVGGAAVLVLCPQGTATRDIDAMPTEGLPLLMEAIGRINQSRRGAPLDVNTRCDPYEVHFPEEWREHLLLSMEFSTERIRVFTPCPEDLAVAKIFRLHAKDADDIMLLSELPGFDRKRFLCGFIDVLPGAIGDRSWHVQSFLMVHRRLYPDIPVDETLFHVKQS